MHLPDRGEEENAMNLSQEELSSREVVPIDIGIENTGKEYPLPIEDLRNFVSTKTGRGPLSEDWIQRVSGIILQKKSLGSLVYF